MLPCPPGVSPLLPALSLSPNIISFCSIPRRLGAVRWGQNKIEDGDKGSQEVQSAQSLPSNSAHPPKEVFSITSLTGQHWTVAPITEHGGVRASWLQLKLQFYIDIFQANSTPLLGLQCCLALHCQSVQEQIYQHKPKQNDSSTIKRQVNRSTFHEALFQRNKKLDGGKKLFSLMKQALHI